MSWEPIIQVLATLLATFLGPWYAFRLARQHQDGKDAREKQAACVHLTLSVLRDYEDHSSRSAASRLRSSSATGPARRT